MVAARAIRAALFAGTLAVVPAFARADETPAPAAEPAPIEQLSQASQSLYARLAGSIIHVRLEQSYSALLTPPQRKDFLEWARTQTSDVPATQEAIPPLPPAAPLGPRGQRRQTRNDVMQADINAGGTGAVRPALAALFRRYIDQKLKDPATDPVLVAKLKQAATRLQQPAGEMIGVVIDDRGNAIVLGGWVRDGAPAAIHVTGSNGKEFSAKYLGGHPNRGIAVITLESPGAALPLMMAEGAPTPGEMLLCMTANTGGMGWIIAPEHSGKKPGDEERFAVFGGEDRGATYLFNTKGQLAAVGFERFALPMDVLRNAIQWIIENRRDVSPRQLGVKYIPVPPAIRRANRVLANRTAIVVQEIAPNSPAEKAGLKKDDIVITIDHRPIWQMPQIQWDIATQTDAVPIGIIRDDRELTLEMPTEEQK
jgi:S1-C subfamily serine protease